MESLASTIEQIENGTLTDKVIEIKSIYKNGKTTVQPVKDNLANWYKGIERLSEDDKRKRRFWAEPQTKFTLKDGVSFDLTKEEHKVTWGWVKYQPCLAMSFDECQFKPGAEFYVYMRNKEALDRVSRKELKAKAFNYVIEDNPVNFTLRTKLLGVNMDGESDLTVVKDFLLDRAELSPIDIIKLYEDKFISLRMLVISAVEKRIIIFEPSSGSYRYGNLFLGMSEDSVVAWMNHSDNKETMKMLEKEVNPSYFTSTPKKKQTDANDDIIPPLDR